MLETLSKTDKFITQFIYNTLPHNIFFDTFFSFMSFAGSSVIIWIVIFTVLFIKEQRENRKFLYIFSTSLLTTAFSVEMILKHIFQRQRPLPDPTAYWRFACPLDFGFPSTHAAAAFAAAIILSYFDEKRRWFYYALAVLVSLSRIYLGCHYLIDVTGGAIIGTFISITILKLYGFPLTKKKKR